MRAKSFRYATLATVMAICLALMAFSLAQKTAISEKEARVIAKEACVYGFPIADNYRIICVYVDYIDSEFKALWSQISNKPHIATPDDNNNLTFYIQKKSPGKDKKSNWLNRPFQLTLRFYWLKGEVFDGRWNSPAIKRLE